MIDPIIPSLTIRQPTFDTRADLLTIDSVNGDVGNGGALRFMNNSTDAGLGLTIGRIGAMRVDAQTVRMDLGVSADPSLSSGDDTPALLSLERGAGAPRVRTGAGSTLEVGGLLSVLGGARLNNGLTVNGLASLKDTLGVTGATSLYDRLNVSGATHLSQTLTVVDATDLRGGLHVNGLLRIDTDTPTYRATESFDSLHAPGAPGLVLKAGAGGTTDVSLPIYFRSFASGSEATRALIRAVSTGNLGELAFHTQYGGDGRLYERMRIDSLGNVGIGIAQPRSALHVGGRILITPPEEHGQAALNFASPDGTREVYLNHYIDGYPYQDLAIGLNSFPRAALGAGGQHLFIGTRTEHTLALATADRPRLVVDSDGNVGIGATNPQARLHIRPAVRNDGIRLEELGDGDSLTGRFLQIYYEGGGRVVFYHQDGRGQFMTPDGKWNLNSDVSLKDNITRMEGALARVMQLKPVNFTWRNSSNRDLGFVAQDVEAVFPDLVSSVNTSGTPIKGLPYASFAVLAIAALQELAQAYEARFAALERQVNPI